MNKGVTIVPIGDNADAIFVGIRDYPTGHVVILSPVKRLRDAERAKRALAKFKIGSEIVKIQGDLWEETFRAVSELNSQNPNIVINTSATRDYDFRCAVTCAAFVNGLRAFGATDTGETMLLPVLKFSYYRLLTERKLALLRALDNPNCCASLQQLSRKTEMSLPLVSYHVNGNTKTPGLVGLGLAETRGRGRMTSIHMTSLGRMLIRGYVGQSGG